MANIKMSSRVEPKKKKRGPPHSKYMRISESLNFEVAGFGDLRVIWGFGFLVWGKTQNVKAPRCFRRSGSSDTHSKPLREEYLERVSRASAEAAGVY